MVMEDPDMKTHGLSIITSLASIKLLMWIQRARGGGGTALEVFTGEGNYHLPLLLPFKDKCVTYSVISMSVNRNLFEDPY